jgi:hypothetical protein
MVGADETGESRYKLPGPGGLERVPGPDYVAYDFVFLGKVKFTLEHAMRGSRVIALLFP